MNKIRLISVLVILALIYNVSPAYAAYTLTDLGTLGGNYSIAIAINEAGQVIGRAKTASGQQHAFVWEGGVMTDLGTLGGSYSNPAAINEAGQIIGYAYTAGDTEQHAFVWEGGVMTDLGTFGGGVSDAVAINEAGQIIGNANITDNAAQHAFIWQGGMMTDLGTLGGSDSFATALNEAGQVIGYSYTAGNAAQHAFLWEGGVMTDLSTLGGSITRATAINEAGQVIGYAYTAGDAEQHVFVWEGGVMTDLGTLGGSHSFPVAINGAGQVIGEAYPAGNAGNRAFVWEGGVMTDLGTFGGNYSFPVEINEAGQVTGAAYKPGNGSYHAFVWDSGVMTDLSTFGGSHSYSFAINEAGQVVGYAYMPDSQRHAFVWDGGVMTDLGTLGGSFSEAIAINETGHILGNAYTTGNVEHHAFVAMAMIQNPVPGLNNLSPASAQVGSPDLTLSLTGTDFATDAVVRWYDNLTNTTTDLSTTYVSPSNLSAVVPSGLLAVLGTFEVSVFNPAPGGGTSISQVFFTQSESQAATLVLGQPDFANNAPNSTQTGMNGPTGIAVDRTTGKIFVADCNNNRILRFASVDVLTSGAGAEAVLGQPDFTSNNFNTARNGMYCPDHISIDSNGRLWVADYYNSRVLRFDNAASKANGADADGVLGQPDFTTSTPATTRNGMSNPEGVFADADGRVWVADLINNRVLRFDNAAAKADGANADGVLGQPDFTNSASSATQNGMYGPSGVFVDSSGRLWVAEFYNHRVLRFDNAASKANGANADGVLGQPDFTSNTAATTQSGMNTPVGVAVDAAGHLYISDGHNNRILVFENAAALANGAHASNVLGQPDFTTYSPNTGGISAATLSYPYQLFYDPVAKVLWVTEYINHRVLMYGTPQNPVPGLSNLSPASAQAGSADMPLGIGGSNFAPNAVVRWYNPSTNTTTDLATTYVSQSSLSAVVPAALLAAPGSFELSVFNPAPGGGTSTSLPFFVTQNAVIISNSDTSTSTSPTGTAVASTGGGGPGTPGSLTTTATGTGTVTVALYDSNPGDPAPFTSTADFFDVYIAADSSFSTVTILTCNLSGFSQIYWWDGDNWLLVSPQSYDSINECITMDLSAGSSPTIADLTGTVFGVAGYAFSGFFQPVDNLPTLNSVKAGQAIPVKFSLGGDQGLNIFAAGYPKSQTIACDTTAPVDGIEVTVTAASSSLTYDPTTNQYTYVWKTQKSWAGTCRQLIVKLSDGTYHLANFQFK